MSLLDKLKSLLGLGNSSRAQESRETSVTVERDTRREREEVDAESEAAAEGIDEPDSEKDDEQPEASSSDEQSDAGVTPEGDEADEVSVDDEADEGDESVAEGTDASASTESMADQRAEGQAAEPNEAVSPAPHGDDTDIEDIGSEADDDVGDTTEDESAVSDDSAAEETDASASTASMVDREAGDPEVAEPNEAVTPGPDEKDDDTGDAEADTETLGEDEEVEESDEDVEESDEDEAPSVDTVKGIGPAYADRLNEAGVHTVSDLKDADAADLSGKIGVSEKRIGRWIDRAQE